MACTALPSVPPPFNEKSHILATEHVGGACWETLWRRKCRSTRSPTSRQPLTFCDPDQLRLGFRACCSFLECISRALCAASCFTAILKSPSLTNGSSLTGLVVAPATDPRTFLVDYPCHGLPQSPRVRDEKRQKNDNDVRDKGVVSRGAASCA